MGADLGYVGLKEENIMSRDGQRIVQALVCQWANLEAPLQRMHQGVVIKPSSGDGWSIFKEAAENNIGAGIFLINVEPIVFKFPERGDALDCDLFIVVRGRLFVSRDADNKLITQSFATEAAYFRYAQGTLHHVYGAHYDFALDELGHPSFHMQMKSFFEFSNFVFEKYPITRTVDESDPLKMVLRNVRLPSAQMDVFSFFIQICADHLLHKGSGPEEKAAFNSMLSESAFLRGAGYQVARLSDEAVRQCYRAFHWYPMVS